MLAPTVTSAQFGSHSRFEIGYSYVSGTAQYVGTTNVLDYSTVNQSFVRDSNLKMNMTAVGALSLYAGLNFPVKQLGANSTLAFSVALMYNTYNWLSLNPGFGTDGRQYNNDGVNEMDGLTTKIALPLGLDLKVGTDALCKRKPVIGVTVGAGIMPQYNSTTFTYNGTDPAFTNLPATTCFGVNGYVKGEISFITGISYKLKVVYSFGDMPLVDHTNNVLATNGPFKLTEKSNLTVTYSVLPFSIFWKHKYWYNDYETGRYVK